MSKSTNVFFRIFDAFILILVTFLYLETGSSIGFKLVSTAIFGIIAYRQHYFAVILDALIVLLCVIIFRMLNVYVDLLYVIIDALSLFLTGSITGLMLKYGQKHFSIIVGISLSELLITILSLLSVKRAGYDIFETLIAAPVRTYADYASQILSQSGAYSEENIELINDMINAFISGISTLMPAILIIISVVFAYFSYVFTKKILELLLREKVIVQPFCELKMNRKASIAALTFVVLSFIIPPSVAADAILNIVVIFLFAYFVCGVSIIDYYFKKTKIWWWARLIIYIVLFTLVSMFASIIPLSLVLLAMLDARQDVRHIDIPDIVVEIKDDEDES